jgi:hypothetical protein
MRRAVTHVGSPIHSTNTRRLLEAKKRPGPLWRLIETFAQSEIELCTSKDRASQFSNRNKKRDPAMIAADSSFASSFRVSRPCT